MRRQNTFEIEGYDRKFTVKELTVKEIIGLIDDKNLEDLTIAGLKKVISEKFLPLCSNVSLNDLYDMTPGEIEIIWEKFKEVNSSFFVLARTAGLEEIFKKLKLALINDFSKSLASL